MSKIIKQIFLASRENGADKVYNIFLAEVGGGFTVTAENGRRGGTLSPQVKTPAPVTFEKAEAIFEKLNKEKQTGSSHYEIVKNGLGGGGAGPTVQPVAGTADERQTEIRPQLANSIGDAEALALIEDANWGVQEKFDGKRVMVLVKDGIVTGINRKGQIIAIPDSLQVLGVLREVLLDGELVGEDYFVFDLLHLNGADYTRAAYSIRHAQVVNVCENVIGPPLVAAMLARTPASKRKYIANLRARGAEGAIFRNLYSLAQAGRPNSGGDLLKFKFIATATCIVGKPRDADKHSIGLLLTDTENTLGNAGTLIRVGNVTIPQAISLPRPGTLVEVRYLYAFRGGSLFQAVYLSTRDDLDPEDATTTQLKYKAEVAGK